MAAMTASTSTSDHSADSTSVKAHPLPMLTEKSVAYPGCCLAISAPLFAYLYSLLRPPPALALSIGSGFGLLEAHLLALPLPNQPNMIGVEVEPSSNRYLSAENHRTVQGSRFLEPLAEEAATWLFVYPRRVGLINEYMHDYGRGSLERIIWIGPQSDWNDYMGCFEGWSVQTKCADEVGGRAWELVAIANRGT